MPQIKGLASIRAKEEKEMEKGFPISPYPYSSPNSNRSTITCSSPSSLSLRSLREPSMIWRNLITHRAQKSAVRGIMAKSSLLARARLASIMWIDARRDLVRFLGPYTHMHHNGPAPPHPSPPPKKKLWMKALPTAYPRTVSTALKIIKKLPHMTNHPYFLSQNRHLQARHYAGLYHMICAATGSM